jgi:hypothetical protein
MHENRESSWTSWLAQQDRSAKAINRTADTNVQEQSDCVVVPMNQPDKEGPPSAEVGEGRAQTVKWTPGVRHEVKGVIAVRCKSVAGEVAVDPLWKHLSGG